MLEVLSPWPAALNLEAGWQMNAMHHGCNAAGTSHISRRLKGSKRLVESTIRNSLKRPARTSAPCASAITGDLRTYFFERRDVEFVTNKGEKRQAYLTEEKVQAGDTHKPRALLLIPDAYGFKSNRMRRLADRLALSCRAYVLVPDLLAGGQPWPVGGLPPTGQPVAEWAAGALPLQRVADDLHEAFLYLRTDLRVGSIAMIGAGLGAQLVFRAMSAGGASIDPVAGVALCPPRLQQDELETLRAPAFIAFDAQDDEEAAMARQHFGLDEQLISNKKDKVLNVNASGHSSQVESAEKEIKRARPPRPTMNSMNRKVMQFHGLHKNYGYLEEEIDNADVEYDYPNYVPNDELAKPKDEITDESDTGLICAETFVNFWFENSERKRTPSRGTLPKGKKRPGARRQRVYMPVDD